MDYLELIEPELKAVARNLPLKGSIVKGANILNSLVFSLIKVPEEVNTRKVTVAGYKGLKFKVYIFEPKDIDDELPGLVFYHGGAFVYKGCDYHKKFAYTYAIKAKCRVFYVEYHLAPKYKYPAFYDDAMAAYRYVIEHAKELKVNPAKVGVIGDSAGGTLAAYVSNNSAKEGLAYPLFQMLLYPLLAFDIKTESRKVFTDTPLWNSVNNDAMWDFVFENRNDIDPEFAPFDNELTPDLPKTYIETAEYDCLRDEALLYAKKLEDVGVQVTLNETKRTIHGYDSAFDAKITCDNLAKRIDFLLNSIANS